jgi:hypothetical protein
MKRPFDPLAAAKPAREIAYPFVLDRLAKLALSTRPMFGCTAVYDGSRRYIVTTQAPPRPRLCWSATRAPSTWRFSAWPRSCHTSSVHCARPVAPRGWPLESRPPDGLVTHLPP